MKRICVIGNSHLAAIKLGWDLVKNEYPQVELTFFGSPQNNLQDLRIENGALVPSSKLALEHIKFTSKGASKITVRKFDIFVVVALQFTIMSIIELYKGYRAEEHKNLQSTKYYVSNACFMHAARGLLKNSLALEIVGKLKMLTDRPILIAPQPFPSETIVSVYHYWKALLDHGDQILLARCFERIISETTAAGARVLPQPEETKVGEIFTDRKYSEGSVRLSEGYNIKHPEDDCWHMNQEYGAIVLRNLMHSLGEHRETLHIGI